ncbi:MAG: hypothetical protein H6765_07865 [Candidatus Peribacteria bacterium]|nr:MAG: hypothetical protein H6765_07865 [Candidatus Peribacteria bacterium]
MNARNLHYIKKFNPKKAIRLADNKYKTKRFLSQRDIPVPETYALIRNRNELYEFDFSKIPSDEFMIKPNKGSRGRGIKRVSLIDAPANPGIIPRLDVVNALFSRQSNFPDQWYKMSGELVDDTSFRRYLMDILDGKNSLSTVHDQVLIEEVMLPGSGFEKFCTHGLADARVIVFNLIPIVAYVRVPTAKSDGKANLAR